METGDTGSAAKVAVKGAWNCVTEADSGIDSTEELTETTSVTDEKSIPGT